MEGILTGLRMGDLMVATELTWQAILMIGLVAFVLGSIGLWLFGKALQSFAVGCRSIWNLIRGKTN